MFPFFLLVAQGNLDNGKSELVLEPSPVKAVIKKVIGSMVCAFIFMKFVKMYPVKNMKEEDFVNTSSMAYKFWYTMMATSCIRFKYYHAWLLADAICNNSGLGFTGYDKDGNSKWDLISNINVLGFEVYISSSTYIHLPHVSYSSFLCSLPQICATLSTIGTAVQIVGCAPLFMSVCRRNTVLC